MIKYIKINSILLSLDKLRTLLLFSKNNTFIIGCKKVSQIQIIKYNIFKYKLYFIYLNIY